MILLTNKYSFDSYRFEIDLIIEQNKAKNQISAFAFCLWENVQYQLKFICKVFVTYKRDSEWTVNTVTESKQYHDETKTEYVK